MSNYGRRRRCLEGGRGFSPFNVWCVSFFTIQETERKHWPLATNIAITFTNQTFRQPTWKVVFTIITLSISITQSYNIQMHIVSMKKMVEVWKYMQEKDAHLTQVHKLDGLVTRPVNISCNVTDIKVSNEALHGL